MYILSFSLIFIEQVPLMLTPHNQELIGMTSSQASSCGVQIVHLKWAISFDADTTQ